MLIMNTNIDTAQRIHRRLKPLHLVGAALALITALPIIAEEVVQIDVKSILNTRSVTTYSDGKMVPWIMGIDGGGTFSGYMTMAASLHNNDKNPKALPDSGVFPSTSVLPRVVLNYSNADGVSNQTRYVIGIGNFTFDVPENNYSKMFIFLTLGEGPSKIRVTLTYTNDSVSTNYDLPDYAANIPANDPNFCCLISNLAKWRQDNSMAEPAGHNIDALNVHLDVAKVLKTIKVEKTLAQGYMVFWGATGVAPNAVPVKDRSTIFANDLCHFGQMRVFKTNQGLRFVNIPANTKIGIYSVTGRLIAHLNTTNSGVYDWNPVSKLTTGAYLCTLRSGVVEKSIVVPKSE
jgi:hypothetical protein